MEWWLLPETIRWMFGWTIVFGFAWLAVKLLIAKRKRSK